MEDVSFVPFSLLSLLLSSSVFSSPFTLFHPPPFVPSLFLPKYLCFFLVTFLPTSAHPPHLPWPHPSINSSHIPHSNHIQSSHSIAAVSTGHYLTRFKEPTTSWTSTSIPPSNHDCRPVLISTRIVLAHNTGQCMGHLGRPSLTKYTPQLCQQIGPTQMTYSETN